MQTKKLIFNSDDFGLSEAFNEGVKKGFLNEVLTSTCIAANGRAFEHAVKEVLPEIKTIGLGAHLNIIEGKSLTNPNLFCDTDGYFNNGFISLLSKSNNKEFLNQVESEFRAQIEKILEHTEIDHLNSHVHTHAIPGIFNITCKLAKEYNIQNIRTQSEKAYIVPKFKKHLSVKYPVNLIKFLLLNSFTALNKKTIQEMELTTNDYILGVTYTGYMDEDSVVYGLKALNENDCLCEILIHPCYFEEDNIERPLNYQEYLITQSPTIKDRILEQGWELTNYKKLSQN